jgi:hypothetical protein
MSWTRESNGMHRRALLARCGSAALFVATFGQGPLAFAQSAPGDAATAQALFDEARKLSAAGDFAAACPKLAESNRLDPGGGTLTALAVCHESQGKTATAWAEFIEVASSARLARRSDREGFAKQHILALEPKLSKLTVTVDAGAAGIPELEVRRDDIVIGKPTWGTPAPVDPGDHTITARAKGKQPWSTHVKVGDSADSQTVTVPALLDATSGDMAPAVVDAPVEHPSNPDAPASGGKSRQVIGLVIGGGGLALAAVGAGFGVSAISDASAANKACPNSTCGNQAGLADESSAKSAALISDVMFGAAIVAVGVGVVVLVTKPHAAPSAAPAAESFAPLILRGGGGAGYTVRW